MTLIDTPPPHLLNALRVWGTDQAGHSDGSLLEHLVGTWSRLRVWGNTETVCRAGLFHSIYGTQSFRFQAVPLARRAEVAALLGSEAERLAWLFCVCDRRALRGGPAGEELLVPTHATGEPVPIPAGEVLQLLEIEVANLLDQLPVRSDASAALVEYMVDFDAVVRDRVSLEARAALLSWLGHSGKTRG